MYDTDTEQSHVDALYELIGYVIERCPGACSDQLEDRFRAILQSFERCREEKSIDPDEPWEAIYGESIGRNYLIAHSLILQKFVNVMRSVPAGESAAVAKALADFDKQVDRNFENFFAEPFVDGR